MALKLLRTLIFPLPASIVCTILPEIIPVFKWGVDFVPPTRFVLSAQSRSLRFERALPQSTCFVTFIVKNNDPDSRTVWVGSFAFPASLICSSLSQGVWTHVIPKFTSKFFPYFLTWGLWREGSHKHRIICTKTGPLLASLNLLVGGGSL